MYIDSQTRFSEDQDLAGVAAGIVNSTNVVDLGVADAKNSSDAKIWVQVTEEFANTSYNATLQIRLITADNASMSSYTVLLDTGAIAQTSGTVGIPAGYQPPAFNNLPRNAKQYLQMRYTVGTTDFSESGKISAGIILDRQTEV